MHLAAILLTWAIVLQPLASVYETELFVAADGSADYLHIQDAIDDTKSFPDKRITIHIKDGIYNEKVVVHAWNTRLTLVGESRDSTIVTWDDHFKKIDRGRNSTFMTPTLLIQGDQCHLENLTIRNTAGPVGQAIALSVEADRCVIRSCSILGHQDALYVAGSRSRQYYVDCLITGTTDFVFGPATALFDRCEIRSRSNSFITAASTPREIDFGLVFLDCNLTAADGVDAVYLGRPWRDFAKVAYIRCRLGSHIRPSGWDNWGQPSREKTSRFCEYSNTGPGAAPAERVAWSHQLTRKEARQFTPAEIFGAGDDTWWE